MQSNVRREHKVRESCTSNSIILLRSSVINYVLLLDLYGKRENRKSHGRLWDRAACSNVRHITSIFYCDKTDSYHLPRRHVWTIRQSVNWYKDMYNRAIWKPLYCPILIPMTFIRLSSYRSRTRSILRVWRQRTRIFSLIPSSPSATRRLAYYRISVRIITSSLFIKRRVQNIHEGITYNSTFEELNNYYVTHKVTVLKNYRRHRYNNE